MRIGWILVAMLALGCGTGSPASGAAEGSPSVAASSASAGAAPGGDWIAQGKRLYATYCASCHGLGGLGDGPVAPVLTKRPADLTRLTESFGEPLPIDRVADFIDGRAEVAAHGPREMPVWGQQLYRGERSGASGQEAARRGTVLLIAEWLATIQRGATAAP
jgi:mono/diheme cytochrome c family protein